MIVAQGLVLFTKKPKDFVTEPKETPKHKIEAKLAKKKEKEDDVGPLEDGNPSYAGSVY